MVQTFNNLIQQRSSLANVVVTHLPIPYKVSKSEELMEYVDTMFKDVDNMLLIQGTGVEYLTIVVYLLNNSFSFTCLTFCFVFMKFVFLNTKFVSMNFTVNAR